MAKVTITLTDNDDATDIRVEFDPVLVKADPKTEAQDLAFEILACINADIISAAGPTGGEHLL